MGPGVGRNGAPCIPARYVMGARRQRYTDMFMMSV